MAYCSIGAFKMTLQSARFLRNQRENSYTESPHVYVAVEGARTGHIYFPLSHPPYVLQSYGPLFYIVNMGIARASHLNIDSTRMHIRLFVFACFLLSAVSVFLIVRKLQYSIATAVLAALMLLAQPTFFGWNNSVRPDLPCLFVMLLSLYFALGGDENSAWRYALSGIFGGLAFLIKQPGLAVVIAIVAVLAGHKRFRQAAYFVAGAAIPVALVFGILLARQEPFLEQFTTVGKALWSLAAGVQFAALKLSNVSVLVPLAVGAIGIVSAWRENAEIQMLAAFALANWCVGLSGLPQVGSDVNYFLPGLAGCALLLPLAIRTVRKNMHSIAGLILIIFLLCQATYGVMQSADVPSHLSINLDANAYAALRPYRILSDRPILALHGRDPDLLDPFSNHALELAGHWNSAPIAETVRRGDYDLIIMDCTQHSLAVCSYRGVAFFSASVVQAIDQNYTVFCSTMSERVLKPRSREIDATPEMLAPALGTRCGTGMRDRAPGLFLDADSR
jgi:hypothetical protein